MKITKVKKVGKKYKLVFDNEDVLTTYDDVIIENHLLYNKEVDYDLLRQIELDNIYYDAYYKTINFISRKLRSLKEVDEYLTKQNVNDENKNKIIKSSELIEIIEARIEEMFSIINKDITNQGIKQKINNVILTGQGIVNINKSDVAGKINLNIPVKISTGRAISTVKPSFRTSYALVRYIAAKPFTRTVSSSIDTQSNDSFFKTIIERIKEFFYS